jgi:hypothetical protein
MKKSLLAIAALGLGLASCQTGEGTAQNEGNMEKGTFAYDLAFLKEKDSVIVLSAAGGDAQVIVSPKYQAKVFTSTAEGAGGKSFGWINYKAFEGEPDPHMNGYGGEDRLWLGPEGGKFSLYFAPGKEMVYENWHTPPAIDTESWELVSADQQKVAMRKDMSLRNYAGTTLELTVDREVEIIEPGDMESLLGIELGDAVKSVGFHTNNVLTNRGNFAWDEKTGAPCMWNLDMFSPSPKTVIVVPYREDAPGKVATTDYFGEIPADRVRYANGILYLKADGKSRGKLGIPPQRATPFAGSYAADNGVLTITRFDVDPKGVYLNQEWTADKDPLVGDAVNAYNDGPLEDGSQMGPFYEIESVSPAAFLKPGEKQTHRHSVFHFTGDTAALDAIAVKLLGVSLKDIEGAFGAQ